MENFSNFVEVDGEKSMRINLNSYYYYYYRTVAVGR